MEDSAGLYLHFPFCAGKCLYCDFYSGVYGEDIQRSYVAALEEQLRLFGARLPLWFDTLYLGGGTPTVLSPRLLVRTIRAATRIFGDFREITVEANPSADLAECLTALAKAGVNRISLGVQSANARELTALGRRHTNEQVAACVRAVRAAGINNLSLDMMLGIPGQTFAGLRETLDFLLSFQPEHISVYLLRIEPNTPFGKKRPSDLPCDDETADFYLFVCERLRDAGYLHYEISNFCKTGKQSRHNLKYWQLNPYLGIGPGAHSFIGGKRFYFPRDIQSFLQKPSPVADGFGGGADEFVMLRLRLADGFSYDEYRARFGTDFRASRAAFLTLLQENGYIVPDENRLALTEKGFLVSNCLLSELI